VRRSRGSAQTGVLPWLKRHTKELPGPAPRLREGQATIIRHIWRCSSLHPSVDPWIIGGDSAGCKAPRGTNKAVLETVNLPLGKVWISTTSILDTWILLGWSLERFGLTPSPTTFLSISACFPYERSFSNISLRLHDLPIR
jgi:hypothetical protein